MIKDFNKELINRFASKYNFCNGDINKFILLLRKGVYLYEYIDNWKRFDEKLLPNKEDFYGSLHMEEITAVNYRLAKKVYKEFKMNNLGDYHGLYVQSDTLLLAELDLAYFLSAPGLAWQSCLKKIGIILELLTDVNMLLMVQKGIRGGIGHAIHRYVEANNKYMKNYDKNKNHHILCI